jgi:hypothetical protein
MSGFSVKAGVRAVLALFAFAVLFAVGANAQDVVTGTIDKVDTGAKTVAVKSADGTVTVVKYSGKTVVHGLKDGAKGADLAGKEGGHVIVHDVPERSDKVAHSIYFVGDKSVHATEGTVQDVAKGTRVVTVKTADGTVKTFTVAGHATVDGSKDVGEYSVKGVKAGDHVVVYSTEETGKEIAHAFHHL